MMPHILLYEKIHKCDISSAGELLGVNNENDALDNQLVIFLLRTLTCRCRIEHKVVWGRDQLHVEIYVRRNKVFLVKRPDNSDR